MSFLVGYGILQGNVRKFEGADPRAGIGEVGLHVLSQSGVSGCGGNGVEIYENGQDRDSRQKPEIFLAVFVAYGNISRAFEWQSKLFLANSKFFHNFWITLNFALLALGLETNSSWSGIIGFLFTSFPSPAFALSRKKFLTILSSSEWKEMTANRPSGLSNLNPFSRPSSRAESSSFTAMRKAWKVFVAGWILSRKVLGRTESTRSTSSVVVSKGFTSLLSTIAFAIFFENRSSPNPRRTSSMACSSQELRISVAVGPVWPILISRGSSF